MKSFSQVMQSLSGQTTDPSGNHQITASEDWAQGRATFGGLIAAIGNEAMRRLVPRDRPLRSLQTTFVGPAMAGGTLTVSTKILRVGKAVVLAQCEIRDGDQIAATQVGVYGASRPSAVTFKPSPVPSPRAVADINEVRVQPGVPAFMQHFAMRWAEGNKPFSGSPKAPSKAFIRHRDPEAGGESSVIALADCIPTPALPMFSAPAPASSMTWTLELFEHQFDFAAEAWWRIDSDVDAAGDGYVNQTSILNDPNGRPIAFSRQLCAIFN